jgi:DNA-binding response OmpR family regulator
LEEATILVVDDEKINRTLLTSILDKKYNHLIEVENGKEAIKQIENNDVNLILLDLMMPVMNGYEVLKMVRAHPKFKSIPVVVITALSGIEDHAKAIEFGADAFLTKPFNKIVLLALVRNLLKQYNMQKELMIAKQNEVFLATVVTANHEINQPLTSILCSTDLLNNSFNGEKIKEVDKFTSYIERISEAANTIAEILAKLRSIKAPFVKTYLDSVKMVDIHSEATDEKNQTDAEISGLGRSILIVDEETLITDAVSEYLNDNDFEVKVISDCKEAEKEFKSKPDFYDIILIDIKEPEKEGLKLFYDMKNIKNDVRVLLTSAYDDKEEIMKAINLGAEAFLPKPYDTSNLIFLIEKVLTHYQNS